MHALVIDAFEFCRRKEHREGNVEIRDLARLSQELADTTGVLQWSLQGGIDKLGNFRLQVSVAGGVRLMCDRCLTPLDFAIDTKSVLVLAKDETSADELEQLLADDELDVIVGSAALDVMTLVEDDALLALPLAPRHASCPESAAVSKLKNTKAGSPFDVLQKLKDKQE